MPAKIRKTATADTYFDRVREFPLKAIKTDQHHDEAVETLSRLSIRGNLDQGELEYVEALAKLIAEFEARSAERFRQGEHDPLDLLKFLMNESGMSVTKLGALLGSQGVASEVLSGKRELSKNHIRSLARHFHVDPGLFL
jgi:HTH-type transcriptional regulator / antitoxin HigA